MVKLIRGELKDMPKAWAPSPAELSTAIRDEMSFVQRQVDLEQEKLAIADMRKDPVKPKLLDDRIAEAREKMAAEGRKLLFAVDAHSNSRRSNMPVGSTYVGILGAWYGPPGSLHEHEVQYVSEDEMQEILRADMFEPEPVQEEPPAPPAEPEFQDVEF
ncbi:hypothetical protein HJB72_28500 [Rhizobium lentis]|uniref:hypothetical protein n=1 Tax=Rhizobium lentis TaxID=1138194 RepID=UPI001C82A950|nr:hypothetical protein [Rhizobium lentis]MBX5001866.1 hypothetical protein [Rhizobium lentis]